MNEPHGNFDDTMRDALDSAGIKDSRREVSRRIDKLLATSGIWYWSTHCKQVDGENERLLKKR